MFHLSSVRLVASTGFCGLTQSTTCHFLRHFVCRFKWSFSPRLSTVSMMTCDLQVIQSQLLYSSRWESRVCRSEQKKLISSFPNAVLKTPLFIGGVYDCDALKVCERVDIAAQYCQSSCFSDSEKKKIFGRIWADLTGRGRFWFSPGEFMKSVRM